MNSFDEGLNIEVSDMQAAQAYQAIMKKLPALEPFRKISGVPDKAEIIASLVEFILEGLYLNHLLKKTQLGNKMVYRQ